MAAELSSDPAALTAYLTKTAEITPLQVKAARGLLGWSLSDLAARTLLSLDWVTELERGRRLVSAEVNALVRFALEDAGVEFIVEQGQPVGVKLRSAAADPLTSGVPTGRSDLSAGKQRRSA